MSDEKKNKPGKKEEKKEHNKLDRELKQTFPASDPPSHSRPGSKSTESEEDTS